MCYRFPKQKKKKKYGKMFILTENKHDLNNLCDPNALPCFRVHNLMTSYWDMYIIWGKNDWVKLFINNVEIDLWWNNCI